MRLALAMLAASVLPAGAAERYPSVPELEVGAGYVAGKQIPFDIPARGRGWHVYYVKSKAVGNGVYDVRIRLR